MTDPADPADPADPDVVAGASERAAGVLRNSAVMAVATVGSRLSGFVRSLVLVWALGTAIFADSFNLANTIPTSIYILVAGGALNSVFMPQLVRAMKRDDDRGEAFAQRLITLVSIVLATMSVVAVIAAPWLVRLWANPAMLEPASRPYFDIAVMLARYCLPQIFFYGLYVILGQILNSRGRFGPMMWAPLLNNVVSIAVLLTYIGIGHHITAQTVTGVDKAVLGIGSTLGIVAQALCLLPLLKKVGFRFRFRFDLRGQGLSTSSRLALWTIGFVIVNQVWFVIASRITTGVSAEIRQQGRVGGFGLTPFLTAYTIFQLPHSVITVSLVTALLPTLSRLAADHDLTGVREDLSNTLRTATAVLAPAAAVFVVLGPMFTQAIFSSGSVTPAAARYIGLILAAFGPAVIPFSSHYVTLRAYYAHEDTRTPLLVQFVVIGVGITFALIANTTLPPRTPHHRGGRGLRRRLLGGLPGEPGRAEPPPARGGRTADRLHLRSCRWRRLARRAGRLAGCARPDRRPSARPHRGARDRGDRGRHPHRRLPRPRQTPPTTRTRPHARHAHPPVTPRLRHRPDRRGCYGMNPMVGMPSMVRCRTTRSARRRCSLVVIASRSCCPRRCRREIRPTPAPSAPGVRLTRCCRVPSSHTSSIGNTRARTRWSRLRVRPRRSAIRG